METGQQRRRQPIEVLIVTTDRAVRQQIRATLRHHDDIKVAGEAGNGDEALEVLQATAIDVALLGPSYPGRNAFDACRLIAAHESGARTIVMAVTSPPEAVVRAFHAGCDGYCRYDVGAEILGLAIRTANRGDSFLCPAVARPVIDRCLSRVGASAAEHHPLTARQREVLHMVAQGWRTKEIARALDLSTKTVESHRAAIMRRLGVSRVVELVHEAARLGLVPPRE